MPLSAFHPVISRWFLETLGEPTTAQRDGWDAIRSRRHTLIAAPTGSGKTLAAFLIAIDELFQNGLAGPHPTAHTTRGGGPGSLPDETRILYVSPLKALSADIHKNLAEPRAAIRRMAREAGLDAPRITAAVRTGDTPQAERAAMLRQPPHLLVTTPESLYLLLTAERSRAMLGTVHTVIVDEIHAVIGSRRGAHLALSLERLEQIVRSPLLRVGLSATQRPIEQVAHYLVGASRVDQSGRPDCVIVDQGHRRAIDLTIEIPKSPLEAVMAHEVWEEYYDRIAELIREHRTTLVFANTRRMTERVARHLSERLGHESVTAHHGSLSKEKRLDAEQRLRAGTLKALVATASLELGIDIGHVDLVCQIGSPHWISTLLQRVGRSGHTLAGMPRGRLFPTSRDDLIECAALLRAVGRGELDRQVVVDGSLDVLAQQVVAEAACVDYGEDDLFDLARRSYPYRNLARQDFDRVIRMLADGFATKRGRRGALIHHDEVNRRIKSRRGARLVAITSGGAIPENADYRVVLDPGDIFIGTLNEDFAIESMAGDVFQLGNSSWRILQVSAGTVRVQDARGAPPNIPFWLGEAPARSAELSAAVSELREGIGEFLTTQPGGPQAAERSSGGAEQPEESSVGCDHGLSSPAIAWLADQSGVSRAAAEQIVAYLADAHQALGVLPSQRTLVLERFFDESGGMQLVLHAPFGSRINRAWGLALRKRFCRQFNFELQAAATEEAVLLSLGPQHSFPLADVFRYLHPAGLRDLLIQAFLDAPVFQTRWRWNTTISLAVPRSRSGKKLPPPLQRMQADDLMAAVFPDAAACLENIPGDRTIPDHPLVTQTIRDCLEDAMDVARLEEILGKVHRGEIRCLSRDTPEPSPLCHEILTARPYAFLDDAPLEERRAQAVYARRAGAGATGSSQANDLGQLDTAAIARVRDEAWPDARDADELHDGLLTAGFLTETEGATGPRSAGNGSGGSWSALFQQLCKARRATRVIIGAAAGHIQPQAPSFQPPTLPTPNPQSPAPILWVAAEKLPEILAALEGRALTLDPWVAAPPSRAHQSWTRERALVDIIRGRLSILGPADARSLAAPLGIDPAAVDAALLALEEEGVALRGHFTMQEARLAPAARAEREGARRERLGVGPQERKEKSCATGLTDAGSHDIEWCDRRLLARIHRYTLNRLRAEIEPVAPADFMRFLFAWQRREPARHLSGGDGLRAIVSQLDGFEAPAGAWEQDLLPSRLDRYDSSMLDTLTLGGEVGWGRLSASSSLSGVTRSTPIALFLREHLEAWIELAPAGGDLQLSDEGRHLLALLQQRGASFLLEIDAAQTRPALAGPAKPRPALAAPANKSPAPAEPAKQGAAPAALAKNDAVERAVSELVAAGLVASDGFAGLRLLLASPHGRPRGVATGGRWFVLRPSGPSADTDSGRDESAVETQAKALLRRYGVVFRRLLAREPSAAPWRDLVRVYRRLEARGEIRGGRFVAGMAGEQFALPDAVSELREVRRTAPTGRIITICGADPLNLSGIVTAGERIAAVASTRIACRDGVPLAAMEGDYVRPLAPYESEIVGSVTCALAGRVVPAVLEGFVGRV